MIFCSENDQMSYAIQNKAISSVWNSDLYTGSPSVSSGKETQSLTLTDLNLNK